MDLAAEALVTAARSVPRREPLCAAVAGILRYADAVIASHQPPCWQCGRCCQFDKLGHNLFVTTAEAAYFLRTIGPERLLAGPPGECPFLRLRPGRCTARTARPLGCRIFHCHPSTRWWQPGLYGRLHRRMQGLHERFDVPYLYAEWLAVLRAARPEPFE